MTFLNVSPALDWPAQFCAFTTVATYVASIATSNVSQVDRLWTFLPTIYTAYYALLPLFPNTQPFFLFPYSPKALGWSTVNDYSPRALLMFALITIWMFRLSYNTYRRGLFNLKDEDYRWAVLRKQLPPWFFQVVNLTFISAIQNVLLLLLGFPAKTVATQQPHGPLALSDIGLTAAALLVLAFEFISDNQQFAYQTYKHALLAKEQGKTDVQAYDESKQWPGARLAWTPDDAHRGFITRGLWRFSRHPNFACEQTFWWIIALFPLLAPPPPSFPALSDFPPQHIILASLADASLRPKLLSTLSALLLPAVTHLLPALALTALGLSSTAYTEAITQGKYPRAYAAYQRRVGMFSPLGYLEKGLVLRWWATKQRREEVEELVWGDSVGKKGQ